MKTVKYLNVLIISALLLAFTAQGAEETVETVLAKARQNLGTEAKLNSVESLYYEGTIKSSNSELAKSMRVWFKAPSFQRTEIDEKEGSMQVVVCTPDEAFTYLKQGDKTSFPKQLRAEEARSMVINTLENLKFFEAYKYYRGATAKYDGVQEVSVEGKKVKANCITITYPNINEFKRCFDVKTGRLLTTLFKGGAEVVESEQMMQDDIRFPKEFSTFINGKFENKVNFSKVQVNPKISNELFAYPTNSMN